MKNKFAFTLIEFLVGISLFSCVLFFVVPSLQGLYKKQQFFNVVDEVKMAVTLAKRYALLYGQNVYLAPLLTKEGWSGGLQLVANLGSSKETDGLYHVWQWTNKSIKVFWHGFNSDHYLLFSPSLKSSALSGSFVIESKLLCRQLTLNRLGKVNTSECAKNIL